MTNHTTTTTTTTTTNTNTNTAPISHSSVPSALSSLPSSLSAIPISFRQTKDMITAWIHIQKLVRSLELPPHFAVNAMELYQKYEARQTPKKRKNIIALTAAALFYVAQQKGSPVTLKHLCETASISRKDLSSCLA
jgi:transcription initiation factor TFIIIB Brf1 subunit/transcription initiation factor TFIIB